MRELCLNCLNCLKRPPLFGGGAMLQPRIRGVDAFRRLLLRLQMPATYVLVSSCRGFSALHRATAANVERWLRRILRLLVSCTRLVCRARRVAPALAASRLGQLIGVAALFRDALRRYKRFD